MIWLFPKPSCVHNDAEPFNECLGSLSRWEIKPVACVIDCEVIWACLTVLPGHAAHETNALCPSQEDWWMHSFKCWWPLLILVKGYQCSCGFVVSLSWDGILLCRPGWPNTHCRAKQVCTLQYLACLSLLRAGSTDTALLAWPDIVLLQWHRELLSETIGCFVFCCLTKGLCRNILICLY